MAIVSIMTVMLGQSRIEGLTRPANSLSTVPYPFLGDMQPLHRAVFYSACAVVNVMLFKIANGIHLVVDRQRGNDVQRAIDQADGKSQ